MHAIVIRYYTFAVHRGLLFFSQLLSFWLLSVCVEAGGRRYLRRAFRYSLGEFLDGPNGFGRVWWHFLSFLGLCSFLELS